MNKLLIAALAASAMSMATAAYADPEVEESLLNRSIVGDVDATLTEVDYRDRSLDVTGNDLLSRNDVLSNNKTYTRNSSEFDLKVDDSFNRVSHDTAIKANLTNIGNEGFNNITQNSGDSVAVSLNRTTAVYNYQPDNARYASHQNDFSDLHKVSVSAVGAVAGATVSIGRTDER